MKRHTLATGAVALGVIAGGGAAIAATTGSPRQESQAIIEDAAGQLGVTSAQLEDALKSAMKARVDAAVADGRLTQEQADELKDRIDAGELPLVGFGPGPGHHRGLGPFGGLDAAADYLGLSAEELRTALHDGDTLADLAEDAGKSVDGLVDALVASATERLDEAVADGRLTQEQAEAMAADLEERMTGLVNGELRHGPHPRFDDGESSGTAA